MGTIKRAVESGALLPRQRQHPHTYLLGAHTTAHAELVIGNIVRRVLHMVREEEQAGADEDAGGGAGAHAAEEHLVCFHSCVCVCGGGSCGMRKGKD